MVSCRSCGRNITSGTLRCSQCNSPYHLSCSHRYQISHEGIFSLCCGINQPIYQTNNFGYQTRNRNKRRQPQPININRNFNNKNNLNNLNNLNKKNVNNCTVTSEDNSMKFAKIQKTTEIMTIDDKPIIISETAEIIQEDFNENENDYQNDNQNDIQNEIQNEVNNEPDDEIIIETDPNELQLEVHDLTNDVSNKVTLETVWQGISSLQSSISNISNSLTTVSTQLNTFDPRINELESTLNIIKTKTSNLENVQEDVSGLRSDLEKVSIELENLKTMQPDPTLNISDVLSEIREREVKSKNILIYNVPEDNLRISQDYSTLEDINQFNALLASRDTSRAREILSNIPNIDLDDIDTRRLGRVNPNNTRPLRVTLQSREDVIMVMKNKGLVNRPYNVKTDLTKFQQKRIRELREELDQTNHDKDNPTMTIKFVNGEPKIVPIRRNLAKYEG